MEYSSDFDLDLEYGELHEEITRKILVGDLRIEVKTDRQAHMTGNVAIETRCRGKPSGISITTADFLCGQTGEGLWSHQKANINLVADFVSSLPSR